MGAVALAQVMEGLGRVPRPENSRAAGGGVRRCKDGAVVEGRLAAALVGAGLTRNWKWKGGGQR